jgi:hypothetical protein
MTPCRQESELGRVLSELCPGITFDEAVVHNYYVTLASLIGGWLSEQGRLETSPVKKTLLTLAKDLSAASALLGGLETGLRSDLEIEITSRVQNLMALNPTNTASLPSRQVYSMGSWKRSGLPGVVASTATVAAM